MSSIKIKHKHLLLAFLFLTGSGFSAWSYSGSAPLGGSTHPQTKVAAPAIDHAEVDHLSKILDKLTETLKKEFGVSEVYIGGGSSRAILDHIYFGKPLEMRDFDVFTVANQQVDPAYCKKLGTIMDGSIAGKFQEKDLRPRPRGNPHIPGKAGLNHNAGYGFFWVDDHERMLDLSIYHTQADLNLNGLFDVDRIMIPITSENTLSKFVEKAQNTEPARLLQKGMIIDEDNGYESWINKNPKIKNWHEVKRDPLLQSIRVTRSYSKVDKFQIDPATELELKNIIAATKETNRLQIGRNMLKLLEDKEATQELGLLSDLGTIRSWSPELNSKLSAMGKSGLSDLMNQAQKIKKAYPREAIQKFFTLLDQTSLGEKVRLLHDIQTVEPGDVNAEIKASLVKQIKTKTTLSVSGKDLEQIVEKVGTDKDFATEVARILDSPQFSKTGKSEQVARSILKRVPETDFASYVSALKLEKIEPHTEYWKKLVSQPRKAFYTGVFNPIHKGHTGVVNQAIADLNLDEVVLVPTPATTHNELPVELKHRLEMSKLSFDGRKDVSVLPEDLVDAFKKGTGNGIDALIASDKNAKWFQLMGADSFERMVERKLIEPALKRSGVYVVDRGDVLKHLKIKPVENKLFFAKDVKSFDFSEENRSSSQIRNARIKGESIDDWVEPKVAAYIEEQGLYLPEAVTGSCNPVQQIFGAVHP